MKRSLLGALCALVSSTALAGEAEVFHGWSKDGTWLVYETHGENDVVELFFCQTDQEVTARWPKQLDELDKEDGRLTCVRFIDPNKAPYQWKKQLVLPAPSMKFKTITVAHELVLDGENPGVVLQAGANSQACYVSGLKEDSKLQKVWFHPNGRWAASQVDGRFSHCAVTVKYARPKK